MVVRVCVIHSEPNGDFVQKLQFSCGEALGFEVFRAEKDKFVFTRFEVIHWQNRAVGASVIVGDSCRNQGAFAV